MKIIVVSLAKAYSLKFPRIHFYRMNHIMSKIFLNT